ncbi:hypothetical protein [Actinomadura sp. WMMB 499]|uniref:hypothetical protein n=1 Tax=Actinomadura sp. WMMB 499 TaxID=1219491 RepID=UPI001245A168|nr:hypothetical protein [Actinomadura sp. WMMB 499]QFG22868.1 hypothetical protein F7P10_18855 [Actinomadura sp. WMMB 499]
MAEVWIRSDAGAIVRADAIIAFTVAGDELRASLLGGDERPLLKPRPLAGDPSLHDGIEVEVMAAAAAAETEDAHVVVLAPWVHPERGQWVYTAQQILGRRQDPPDSRDVSR